MQIDWLRFGAPSNSYTMNNGGKILTYNRSSGVSSFTNYDPNTNSAYTYSGANFCKTEFIVNASNTISSWRWQGNTCRARAPKEPQTETTETTDRQHNFNICNTSCFEKLSDNKDAMDTCYKDCSKRFGE